MKKFEKVNSDFVPASTVSRRRYSIGLLKKYEKEALKNLLILFRCAKRSILPNKTETSEKAVRSFYGQNSTAQIHKINNFNARLF